MQDDSVGYLDFDGKFTRFRSAKCKFANGKLDVEAKGAKCKLHLHGIPFNEAKSIDELPGKAFGPTSEGVNDDPMAEGGVETKSMWLSFKSIEVKCRSYDSEANVITVWFSAEVEDSETGRSGTVDCSVRCTIVDSLW
jgi:hypothetical protein